MLFYMFAHSFIFPSLNLDHITDLVQNSVLQVLAEAVLVWGAEMSSENQRELDAFVM